MSKNLIVLSNDNGYEALYFNDFKVNEGYPLEGGSERFLYFLSECDTYGIEYNDLRFLHINSVNLPYGELPDRLSEVLHFTFEN